MKTVTVQVQKSFNTIVCDVGETAYKEGDLVVVETAEGQQLGTIMCQCCRSTADAYPTPKNRVLRIATEADIQKDEEENRRAAEALRICKHEIEALQLPMKLLDVHFAPSGDKVTFFFTAETRVNFRDLVKQLAAQFHMRVELRQIGARNEAQKIGGVGCCGRPICCASFLTRFDPVTIRMAKDQGLSLEPAKISGLCGRLLCCLSYEAESYSDLLKQLPKQGSRVLTNEGEGKVVKLNVIEQTFVVDLEEGKRITVTPDELREKAK